MKKEYDFESAISLDFVVCDKLEGYQEAINCLAIKSKFLADVAQAFSGEATNKIPTACVVFSNLSGNPLSLKFNYAFWHRLNLQERAAIIGHEMLHVVLNHGKRQLNLDNKKMANIAMDICVNELLDINFNINPEYAPILNEAVYLDKINPELEKGRCFEYYYKNLGKDVESQFTSIDIHEWMDNLDLHPSDIEKIKEKLKKHGIDASKLFDSIKKMRSKHGGSDPGVLEKIFEKIDLEEYRKAKWGSVLRKIIKKMEVSQVDEDDWFRLPRRMLEDQGIIIPNNENFEEKIKKRNIHIFLDTSGSCSEWSSSFLGSATHFPNDNFNVNLYCFDTNIYPIEAKKPKLNGFGGTSFDSISRYVDKKIKSYDAIIVLTDGYGDNSVYKNPKLWHWVLTTDYTKLVPLSSNLYNIENII